MLLGLIVALKAWGYWLDKYQLLFSTRGVVAGASYTDVKAQLPALEVLFWVALICLPMFFLGARRGGLLIPVISIVLLAGVSLIMGGIIPAIFQRFRVEPQELARERDYIARNIDATASRSSCRTASRTSREQRPHRPGPRGQPADAGEHPPLGPGKVPWEGPEPLRPSPSTTTSPTSTSTLPDRRGKGTSAR